MTQPRRHIAGQVSMLTRRCLGRRYFLRSDDYINQVLPFEVGKAADNHGQHIYGAMAMSNHVHFGVGDTTGDRSDFMRDAMSGIARARNSDLDRSGYFWESGPYGDTVLLGKNDIERKLLYIWLNPVKAGLVKRAKDWPGFKILPEDWGKPIRIEKPDRYYGRRNPDVVEFVPKPPPGYGDKSLEEIRAYFSDLLRKAEDEIAARRKEAGKRVSGVRRIKRLDPMESPSTPDKRGRINPRFAAKNPKLMAAAKASYRAFLDRYEAQRQRWLKGHKVTFPCGTVALKRRAPITCHDPADDEPGLWATG